MYKPIDPEIRDVILEKIKNGQEAPTLASQYGISPETLYGRLRKSVKPGATLM